MKFRDKISSNKIIFLDVDGVLNSQSYRLRCKLNDNSEWEIDEDALESLRKWVDDIQGDGKSKYIPDKFFKGVIVL